MMKSNIPSGGLLLSKIRFGEYSQFLLQCGRRECRLPEQLDGTTQTDVELVKDEPKFCSGAIPRH
jgi:hypothetical protein